MSDRTSTSPASSIKMPDFHRGSMWRKWDLHTHTPLSILNNQFTMLPDGVPEWKPYLAALEATNIAVLGVTDYFTIDGYKELRKFKHDGRLPNIHTLLPNIEFRLDKIVSSRHDGANPRRLNFHVIFSDELDPDLIEEHFLHDLDFGYQGNPQAQGETRKLKRSNIEMLGQRLKEEQPDFARKPPLVVGAENLVVSLDQIVRTLKDDRFKGKYLLILPEELSNGIEWSGQDHHVRKLLVQQSDMLFSSNAKTREWCLGRHPYQMGPGAFLAEFKSLKPCIHGADAHSIEQIDKPCAKRSESHNCATEPGDCEMRFLWIKADPTFEGLKQLLSEPDDRVRIQSKSPEPARGGYTLSSLRIEEARIGPELALAFGERSLNPGLVAVCGGRGAGKTAFVDLLADSFIDRTVNPDLNSFVQRVIGPQVEVKTRIVFQNGESFEKVIGDHTVWPSSDVVYVAQGQLEMYLGNRSALETYVNELIFNSPTIKNSVLHYQYLRLVELVDEAENEVKALCVLIDGLETVTATPHMSDAQSQLAKNKASVADLDNQILELTERIGTEKVNLAEAAQQNIAELSDSLKRHERLRRVVVEIRLFAQVELRNAYALLSEANQLLVQMNLPEIDIADVVTIADLDARIASIDRLTDPIVESLQEAQRQLEAHEADVKQHAKLLEAKRGADGNVDDCEKAVQTMEGKIIELSHRRQERNVAFRKVLVAILDQREKYREMVAIFAGEKADVLSDLDFDPEIAFDSLRLVDELERMLDSRKVRDVREDVGGLIELYGSVRLGDRSALNPLVKEVASRSLDLAPMLRTTGLVTRLAFNQALYSNRLTVSPIVKYKGVGISKLSMGQKATVLLKIYLAEGTKPIIIDSHDDHLDNEYIMDELIEAIRVAKQTRQVILVSNNANVVINGDAEQILIASHDQGVISYESGSIENESIRRHALDVLEGGPEAFKRRQVKYRMT